MIIHVTKPSLPSYFLSISLVALLTASAFVFGMNSAAYACSCALPESAKDALEYSDAVFSGKVTDISGKHPDNLTISRHDPVSVTFSVDRVWKGPANSTMTISTESSEASCGYEFQQNESYVVYSYKKGNPSTLHTGLCSGTSLLSDSYDDLSELGDGTKILQPDDEAFKSQERSKNEPIVLTTFEMHFKEDEFTKQGPNHNILRLDKEESATLNVYIKNNDNVPHQISMKDPRGVGISGTFESFFFEPEQFTILPQQTNSTKLHLTVSNYTDTHSKLVTFLAQSDTFGMRGIGFFIVVDREIDEYVDKSLRRGLPGGAFPHLNTEISESEAEKLIGSGFGIPRYLPSGYEFQGMDGSEDSQRLIYSTVQIVTETTGFSEFWNNGGLLIIYGIDGPNVNNTKSLPFRIAQDEGQQVMINGMMGDAVQKQTRVVAESEITYDVPASVTFFDDAEKKSMYLRANMPLDELLKIASSIPILYHESNTHLLSHTPNYKSEFSVTEKQVRYTIPYVISNGMIDDMTLFCEHGSLLIDVSSQNESDVNLDIELPRNMLDPKTNGKDSRFFILRDGDEIDYDEIPYQDYRKISMSFSPDTDKIEIIHSFIPELKPPMCKVADLPPYSSILPPLKQFKSGIPTDEIRCKDGLTMLLSPKDSRSVCVTGDTANKLIPRHWGILVSRG